MHTYHMNQLNPETEGSLSDNKLETLLSFDAYSVPSLDQKSKKWFLMCGILLYKIIKR